MVRHPIALALPTVSYVSKLKFLLFSPNIGYVRPCQNKMAEHGKIRKALKFDWLFALHKRWRRGGAPFSSKLIVSAPALSGPATQRRSSFLWLSFILSLYPLHIKFRISIIFLNPSNVVRHVSRLVPPSLINSSNSLCNRGMSIAPRFLCFPVL